MSTRLSTRSRQKPTRVVHARVRKSTARKRSRRSESATRLRRFAAAAFESVAFMRDGVIEDCNEQLARMLGCRRKELLNRPFLECVASPDRSRVALQLDQQGQGHCECQMLRKDGSTLAIEVQTRTAMRGHVTTQIAAVRDLSERKQAEHILRVRLRLLEFAAGHSLEETLQQALDEAEELTGSQVGFYHFVERDEKALSLQAWSTRTKAKFCKAEGQGLHYSTDQAGVWTDCVRERRPVIHNDYAALPHRKGLPEGHATLVRELVVPVFRDGRIVAILGVGNKSQDYTQQDVGLATFVADLAWELAERKRAEDELQVTHAGLEEIGISVVRTGPDARILSVNAAACRKLGYTVEELCRLTIFDIDPTFTPERWQAHRDSVPATLTRTFESTHRRKDGSTFPVEVTVTYHTEHGRVFALSFVRDITERKRAEEALRESEQRYRLLFESNPQPMWVYDLETLAFLAVNDAAIRHYGYSREEFLGMTIKDIRPAEDVPALLENVARVTSGLDEAGHWRHRKKDGTIITVEITSHTLRFGGRDCEIVLAIDITARKRAEQALRESEHKFRAVLQSAQASIFMLDNQGMFRLSEGLGLALLGLRPGQVVGQSAFEIYRDTPSVVAGIRRALAGENHRAINRLGELVFDTVYSPYFTPEGRQEGIVGVAIDITERARAEAAFSESQERLALALEGADLGSWDWNVQTREVKVNERWAQMLGYRLHEVAPHITGWETLVHPEDLPGVQEALQAHLDGRTSFYETEHRIRHKTGAWVWVLDRGKVITRDSAGRPLRAAGTHLDITERKRAEEELFASRQMLRMVLDTIPTRVFWKDRNSVYLGCNRALASDCGYAEPDELVGKTDADTASARMAELYQADDRRVMDTGEPKLDFEEPQLRSDGSQGWLHTNKVPLRDQQGRVVGILGTYEDITERKRTEAALRESEERFRQMFEHSRAVMLLVDPESGAIAEANPAAVQFYGYPHNALCRMTIEDINTLPPEQVRALRQAVIAQQREVFEAQHRRARGELRTVEVRSSPVNVGGRRLLFSIVQDITERKQAEEALAHERELLITVINLLPDSVYVKDRDSRFLLANQTAATRLGKSRPNEVLGLSDRDLFPAEVAAKLRADEARVLAGDAIREKEEHNVYPKGQVLTILTTKVPLCNQQGVIVGLVGVGRDITERKRAEEALRLSEEKFRALVETTNDFIWEVDAGGRYTYVSPQIEKLLSYAPDEVLGKTPFDLMPPVEAARVRAAFLDCVAARRPLNNLMNMNRHKEGKLVFLETSGTPILDSAGHLLGYRGIDRDVTERKEAEQERERLFRELEAKNQELERFTYTVSHDLKSPLITIKGFAGALLHDVSAGRQDRVQGDLKRIASATDKMAELLNDLLELSRIGRMMNPPSDVDLDKLLREVVELLAGPASQRKVEVVLQPGLPTVRGDRRRLLEVFQNLIENSIQFMGPQPQPRIEVGVRDTGTKPVFFVRDNGVGIEPSYHETVFGLFNKLDAKTAGTGIGLALVRRIIEVHGGRVWVESEGQGRGATLCFTLPLVKPMQKEPQP